MSERPRPDTIMSYLRGFWLLGMLLAGGCATLADLDHTYEINGGEGGAGGSGGSGGLPSSPYLYRRPIAITTGAAEVPPDYSIALQLDHASLVQNNKSLPNGDDLRIYRESKGIFEELHRRLDPTSAWNTGTTTLWFRLKAGIPASATDARYYLFYGDPAAPVPPVDGSEVYLFWDDFTSPTLDPDWTLLPIGGATGMAVMTGVAVAITASTGDIWDTEDSFVFLYRPVTGDFMADAVVTVVTGESGASGKLGGVMIRESLVSNSRHRLMSPVYSAKARTNGYRLQDGGSTSEQIVSGSLNVPEIDHVTRIGDRSNAYFTSAGQAFKELGDEITFLAPLSPTILVGIPVANVSPGSVTVTVDWFRIRRLVDPEPKASLLPEEPGK
jgi:hypothetical protein